MSVYMVDEDTTVDISPPKKRALRQIAESLGGGTRALAYFENTHAQPPARDHPEARL